MNMNAVGIDVSKRKSAVNPQIIRNFQGQGNPLHKVKIDMTDSVKIARYTLDSWANLKQHSLMDELCSQLKTMNRQFDFYMKYKTAMKNICSVSLTRLSRRQYLFRQPCLPLSPQNIWLLWR